MRDDPIDAFGLWFALKGGDVDGTDMGAAFLAFNMLYEAFDDGDMSPEEMVLCMDALGFEPTEAFLGLFGNDDLDDDFMGLIDGDLENDF